MATGTLYLRPSADLSVGHNRFPADSPSAYLLINEETSDGSATYIQSTDDGSGTEQVSTSKFRLSNTSVVGKAPIYITAVNIVGEYYSASSNDAALEINGVEANTVDLTNKNFNVSYPDAIEKINEYLLDNEVLPEINIIIKSTTYTSTTDGKTSTYKSGISQIYVLLTYEIIPYPVYHKENGAWKEMSAIALYRKENGTWVEQDDSILTNGARYELINYDGIKYTIRYNANNGSDASTEIVYIYGIAQSISSNSFSYAAHKFIEWNTKPDGSGTSYSPGQLVSDLSDVPDAVIDLYAQWVATYTVRYHANGGSGTMTSQTVDAGKSVYLRANTFTSSDATYRFAGWNTERDGSGVSYSDKQKITPTSSMTLYAQWSNLYTVTYKHTNHTNLYGDNDTGHTECYALYINGELKPKFGTFAEGSTAVYYVPYGSTLRVVVSNFNADEAVYNDADCDVYLNDRMVASGYRGTEYTFTLTTDTTVDFRWKIAGSLVTFNAQSWEDCYITT